MEKATVIVDVDQPLIQTIKNVNIDSNTTTEITPDEGYDAVRKVNVTTDIQPNLTTLNTQQLNTYIPISPAVGYSQVTFGAINGYDVITPYDSSDITLPELSYLSSNPSLFTKEISKGNGDYVYNKEKSMLMVKQYTYTSNGTYYPDNQLVNTQDFDGNCWVFPGKITVNVQPLLKQLQNNIFYNYTTSTDYIVFDSIINQFSSSFSDGYDGVSWNSTIRFPKSEASSSINETITPTLTSNNTYTISSLLSNNNNLGITKDSTITVNVPATVPNLYQFSASTASISYGSGSYFYLNDLSTIYGSGYNSYDGVNWNSSLKISKTDASSYVNETWNNKRITSNGSYTIYNLMNNTTSYRGISSSSTMVIDVPTYDITQISNYSITSNGTQTIPIPTGYDAVDSISVNVNVPQTIQLKYITYNSVDYIPRTDFTEIGNTNTSVTVNNNQLLIKTQKGTISSGGYAVTITFFVNQSGSSVSKSVRSSKYILLSTNSTDKLIQIKDSNGNIVSDIDESNTSDTGYTQVRYFQNVFDLYYM